MLKFYAVRILHSNSFYGDLWSVALRFRPLILFFLEIDSPKTYNDPDRF